MADVLGLIVHCQNARRWQFEAIQYHSANVCEGRKPGPDGRPTEVRLPDTLFCDYGGKIWRLGRYFAIKEICCRFANHYPRLVRCLVHGPPSPPSPRNNSPGTQIQACAGLNKDGSALAVCLADIGNTPQTITLAVGRRVAGTPRAVEVPPMLDPKTPPVQIPVSSGHRHTLVLTVQGFCAALVEIPLRRHS